MEAFWYATNDKPPPLIVREIDLAIPSNIRGASQAAYSVVRKLNEEGIFGALRENKFIFVTYDKVSDEIYDKIKAEFEDKLLEYSGFELKIRSRDENILDPVEKFEYFRLIAYNAIRYHAYRKLKRPQEHGEIKKIVFPRNKWSGLFIIFDTYSLSKDGIGVQRGLRMTMENFFDEKIMARFDMNTMLFDLESKKGLSCKQLTYEQIEEAKKYSMPSPKARYEYIKDKIEKLFNDISSYTIKLSYSYSLKFEKIEL